ncbi:MAG: hypothetical protein P8Y67_15070 [Alphaproteobacteria bacterium]
MAYFAHDRFGNMIPWPTTAQLEQLLASLDWGGKHEHPDVSVTHETGWCVSVFQNGVTVLENVQTNEGPWHILGATSDYILSLWHLLAEGNIDTVRSGDWQPGYGS